MTLTTLVPLLLLPVAIALWLRERARVKVLVREHREAQERLALGAEKQRALERSRVVAEERERIYADLHDDIGAKLLTLSYANRDPATADQARTVLQDLRDVVSRSRGAPGRLLDVLADICQECTHRVDAMGGHLDWQQAEDLPDPPLDHGQALHLYRIVREAMSNAIRHGQARRLRVRAQRRDQTLLLDVTDDGPGLDRQVPEGRGADNMRHRAAELQGTIRWDAGTNGGTKVLLQFPLPVEPDSASL
jgi:signal transduction histidine kinase